MKLIHLVPWGGLANRIRAVVSAQWTAHELGVDLAVSWELGLFMPAQWEDLFEGTLPPPAPDLAERPTLHLEEERFLDPADPEVEAADVVRLHTCHGFSFRADVEALTFPFWAAVRPYLLRLEPVGEVRDLVDRVEERFRPRTVGVHVRTGTGDLIFSSPVQAMPEGFFSPLDQLHDETGDLQIYLACDAADTVRVFRNRYGPAVIAMDEYLSDDFRHHKSVPALRVALAEILLLSRTERLIGTHWSSFAALAGAIGALPYMEMYMPGKRPKWYQFRPEPYHEDSGHDPTE